MEYVIYTYQDLLNRTTKLSADIAFFSDRRRVVIKGSAFREVYQLDHVADPTAESPWGETYYKKV